MGVKLPKDMQEAFKVVGKGGNVVHLATASADGVPNIVPMRFVNMHDDETIVIADMYFAKTRVNLKENPDNVAISVVAPKKDQYPYIVRGKGIYAEKEMWWDKKAQEIWERWKDWGKDEPPDEVPPDIRPPYPECRGVLGIVAEEVLSTKKGEFGKKIL